MLQMGRSPSQSTASQSSLNWHIYIGMALIVLLIGGIGTWSAYARIAGAVIAPGTVVVETNVKRVQHDEGGVVGEIRVRNADFVEAGDLLIRLDDTLPAANLAVVQGQVRELEAQRARLMAERDGLDAIVFDVLQAGSEIDNAAIRDIRESEIRLFEARRETRLHRTEQMHVQIAQIEDEVGGHKTQVTARDREIALIADELAGVQALHGKGLTPKSRLAALQREEARLIGEKGQLQADIAAARGRASEIEIEILRLEEEFRSLALEQLGEVRRTLNELREQEITVLERLKRIEIRAPRRGYVHQLAVHTVGGVLSAGETAMLIVPDEDNLKVEARVSPQDVDQLHVGQSVILRFSGLNQRTTPELQSEVSLVSADTAIDEKTGEPFYLVRIDLGEDDLAQLGNTAIVPGMPVEAFIQTNRRTVIAYLLQPLTDHLQRVFREV